MKRARTTAVILHALPCLLLASLLCSGAVAQNRAYNPHGMFSKLYGTGRATRAPGSHKFYGVLPKAPDSVTLRQLPPNWMGRTRQPGDQAVVRQTILLSKLNPNAQNSGTPSPDQSEHPFWTSDERYIYFDSDRNSATDPTESSPTVYNIFSMNPDGSGIVQVTTGAANKIEPAVAPDGVRIAYVAGGTINVGASFDNPPSSGFNLYLINLTTGAPPIPLTTPNPSGFNFTDVRHPTWGPGGGLIAFAGQLGAGRSYHIFVVDPTTGHITQETTGSSNDYAPAWSPNAAANVIAFTTNASGFLSGTAPISAAATVGNDDIWVISGNAFNEDPHRVTNFSVLGQQSSNKNAAWSTLRPDPLGIVPPSANGQSQQLLAFASNRADKDPNNPGIPNAIVSTFDIYWLYATVAPDPNNPSAYTVTTPESTGNPGIKLRTSTPDTSISSTDPASAFDPNFVSNEDYPAWPQYLNSYRIAFQSDRGLQLHLWASTIMDIHSPTLIAYDIPNNEIVHVARESAPDVSVREVNAGETLRFRVRVADYETGVAAVYLQIKDPSSTQTAADGMEHKTYLAGPGLLDNGLFLITSGFAGVAAYELDSQAINPTSYAFHAPGYTSPEFAGGSLPSWPGWNQYIAGVDDVFAYSGAAHPPDDSVSGQGYWLRLWDDGPVSQGGHEPPGETAGDGVYTADWTTPANLPSDWYVDVIVYDRSVDPFNPSLRMNWTLYDNIWGFTTQPFTPAGNILYVNDYDAGQKFFLTNQGSSFSAGFVKTPNTIPTESWMTEEDNSLLPTGWVTTTASGPLVNVLTTLGQNSYSDPFTFDGSNFPVTQHYDQWRILSRGPIPASVLAAYAPVIVTQPPDTIGGSNTPLQTEVAEKCVVWHSPYAGDLWVGPGTILDNATQTELAAFVQQGGRLFVDGDDIAWGLTLGGTTPSPFLSQILMASFVLDSAEFYVFPPSHVNLVNAKGSAPIGTDPWYGPENPPNITDHQGFVVPTTPTPTYDPPSGGQINIADNVGDPAFAIRCDAAGIGVEAGPVEVLVGFYDNVVNFLATPVQDVAASDGTYNAYTMGTESAVMWWVGTGTPPFKSKVAFSPFGWEQINPEFTRLGTMAGSPIWLKNRRTELMHNAVCWLRTGRIFGTAFTNQGGTPLANVLVRAVSTHTGKTAATALSQSDGTYVLNGLDPTGLYTEDARAPGFLAQHLEATLFHGAYVGARVDFYLQPAQPGSVTGTVTQITSNQPVAGAIVTATDISEPTNPSPAVFTATTATDGTYTIKNMPSSTYAVSVTNLAALGYSGSVPPSYGGGQPGASPPVVVASSQNVTGINFQLKPLPGTLTGQVTKNNSAGMNTGVPLPGATVTATSATETFSGTTDSNGNYTFTADPGTYSVVAVAPGYAASTAVSLSLASQATITQNFSLTPIPPGSLSGTVATSQGAAVSGATVNLFDAAGNPLKDLSGNVLTGTSGAVQTVGSYSFNYQIVNVPAGTTIYASAQKAGYLPNPTAKVAVMITSGQDTQNVNFTIDPLHAFSQSLTLVSAPYDYTTDVATLLSVPPADVTDGAFQFVAWQGNSYVYHPTPPADTFHLGAGYFLADSDTAASLALTTVGTPANTNQPFPIALQTGWNLLGDPYPNSINFQQLNVQLANGTTETVIAAQGGPNPVLGSALWTYANGAYQIAFTLDPWTGYWLRAFQPCTLLVDSNALSTRKPVPSRELLVAPERGDGWNLTLAAIAGTRVSPPADLGVRREAVDGYDRYKLQTPPMVGKQNVTVTFDHPDWGAKAGSYSVDVRSIAPALESWNATVTSSIPNTPVTVTWPSLASVPGKLDVVLNDLDSNTSFNMRTRASYTIPVGTGAMTRHFRIDVRRAPRQTLQVLNVVARMNGTRGAGASAAIDYTITADATVDISILQNGRRIRTLAVGQSRAAGQVEAVWDLKNARGSQVSANAYMVEIRAVGADGRVVRSVTPLLITR